MPYLKKAWTNFWSPGQMKISEYFSNLVIKWKGWVTIGRQIKFKTIFHELVFYKMAVRLFYSGCKQIYSLTYCSFIAIQISSSIKLIPYLWFMKREVVYVSDFYFGRTPFVVYFDQ